jgi:hypothetical protein
MVNSSKGSGGSEKRREIPTHIILIDPSMSDLEIVILDNQSQKPLHKSVALSFGNIVDILDMGPNGK